MAQLKDSLITGDLRVTGTIYGNVPLTDLISTDLNNGWKGEIKAITDENYIPGLDIRVSKSSNTSSYASIQMLGDSESEDYDITSINLDALNINIDAISWLNLEATNGINLQSNSVKIHNTVIPQLTAQTTQAVYPIKINAIGQITEYGSAVTIPAAVSVKGNAESSYRTGQVNLTPANIGAAAASHTHPIKTITGTIPTSTSSPWTINATDKTVQISDSKITAKSVLQWGLASTATQAQYEAFAEAQFIDSTTAAGSATIKALGTMPTVTIPVVIHILGETE